MISATASVGIMLITVTSIINATYLKIHLLCDHVAEKYAQTVLYHVIVDMSSDRRCGGRQRGRDAKNLFYRLFPCCGDHARTGFTEAGGTPAPEKLWREDTTVPMRNE